MPKIVSATGNDSLSRIAINNGLRIVMFCERSAKAISYLEGMLSNEHQKIIIKSRR